jgi:hypothetical protein
MIYDCGSHEIVAALVSLVDGRKQKHHVFVELTSIVPMADLIYSFDDDLVDDFSSISVDQSDPGVNDVPLELEGDFNRLKHLNATNDIMQSRLLGLFAAKLVHQDQCFDIPLEFSGQIQSLDNQVGSLLQEFSLDCLVFVFDLSILHHI